MNESKGASLAGGLEILYEDEHLIAVNKAEGIASIPERDRGRDSLVQLLTREGRGRLFVVHRLDREVSGVIVFAKDAETHRILNDQFSGREVTKVYRALVRGTIAKSGGSIDRPIREFGSGRMGVDDARGRSSRTDFDVIERFAQSTLVKALPRTGRRHQIRVHFYSIGHPILGDPRYGEKEIQQHYDRMMLHAEEMSFHHRSGDRLTFKAPLPGSFLSILQSEKLAAGRTLPGSPST